jgi:hypothetical protein
LKAACTLLLVLDEEHLKELNVSAPTWFICHPEVAEMPILVLYDRDGLSPDHPGFGEFEDTVGRYCARRTVSYRGWPDDGLSWETHREKMLLGYVHGASHVETPWFLKIDTDAIATERKASFVDDGWFQDDPAFVSNPLYTTRHTLRQLHRLERWAEGVPSLGGLPTPDYELLEKRKMPIKMCSWIMFGNCGWFRRVAADCPRMPVPSQDSFHSYVAMKGGSKWTPVDFSKLGWAHRIVKGHKPSPLLGLCPGIVERYGRGR